MDVRATSQVEQLGSEDLHRLTGKPADTTPALYKLLWLCQHEPETIKRSRWVVDVHAFLVNRLTGAWRTTTACADPLGLIDMKREDWSDDLLARVGLSRERAPTLLTPGEIMGELSAVASEQLGLPAGLPVVGGAGDGQSAGLGANVTRPGSAYLNLGTAVVAGTVSEHYAWDRAFRTLIGAVPGTYAMETLLQGGTYTVNWFIERIATLDAGRLGLGLKDVDLLEAAAARVGPARKGCCSCRTGRAPRLRIWTLRRGACCSVSPATRQGAHVPRAHGGHLLRAAPRAGGDGARARATDRGAAHNRRRLA
jgi:xylulokinase